MNILYSAVNSQRTVSGLPGEEVFLAVEDFLERAALPNEGKSYLSLEDGSQHNSKPLSASLALEELTTSMIAVIVAAGAAILMLMYKLYKYFFKGSDTEGSVHDKVEAFSGNLDSSAADIASSIDSVQDARYTVQDAEAKKKMQEDIDALMTKYEAKITDNFKFAVIADNLRGKHFISYYKQLYDVVDKLSPELLALEQNIDKGVDIIKMIASMSGDQASNNEHLKSVVGKEQQTLQDKLDIYKTKAEMHKLEKSLGIFNSYRAELEKSNMSETFLTNLSKNDAKSFIVNIIKQQAVNMHELTKRLEASKDDINSLITLTKKYEGVNTQVPTAAASSPELKKYFDTLRDAMNVTRNHAKVVLAVAKAEDTLYRAAHDVTTMLVQYTADMSTIVANNSSDKSVLNTTKTKLAGVYKKLTGKA